MDCVDTNGTAAASPILKGVPREWRGMYPAGGAGRNEDFSYKDFWHLFWDTYPPASPYPSERGLAVAGRLLIMGFELVGE